MGSTESLLQSLAASQVKILTLLKQQGETGLDEASMQKLDKVLEETAGLATVFQKLSGLTESVEKQSVQNRKDYESLLKKLEGSDQNKRTTLTDEIKTVGGNIASRLERLERLETSLEKRAGEKEKELWWQRFNWIGIGVFWLLGICVVGWGLYLRHQYSNAEETAKNANALQARAVSQIGALGPKTAGYALDFIDANPGDWKAYKKAHPVPVEDNAK